MPMSQTPLPDTLHRARHLRPGRVSARGLETTARRGARPLVRSSWRRRFLGDREAQRHHLALQAAGALPQRARLAIFEKGAPVEGERKLARHILNMDPPEHASSPARPPATGSRPAITRRQQEVKRITRDLLAEIAGDGSEGTGDFVADLAAPHPARARRHAGRAARRLAPHVPLDQPDCSLERRGVPDRREPDPRRRGCAARTLRLLH